MRIGLKRHPGSPVQRVESVEVELFANDPDDVLLRFIVTGRAELKLPERATPTRTDGLWKSTCFELFLKAEGADAYVEFNFSPSGQWAAYAFGGYREGGRDLPRPVAPHVEAVEDGAGMDSADYVLDADVDLSGLPDVTFLMGLSAVIEATDGTKSYWALAHPPGKPDFHHPDSFALELPAKTRS